MPDQTVVHMGENSPEHVAYKLLSYVASVEQKELRHTTRLNPGETIADRKYILDTYAECLDAARGIRALPET